MSRFNDDSPPSRRHNTRREPRLEGYDYPAEREEEARAQRQQRYEDQEDYPQKQRDFPKKRTKPRKTWSFWRWFFKWSFYAGLWGGLILVGIIAFYAAQMPQIQSLEVPKRPPNIQILFADGSRMADRGEMGGAAIPFAAMPKPLIQALISIEDRRFYSHFGLDVKGLARAFYSNATRKTGPLQGGSTLTQQLAKNLFLTQERTTKRKVQEALLALWLEYKFSKDQIMEMYLNRVYFGAGAYGIEAAAQRMYGVTAKNLTLKQSAIMAGLVQSPSKLNPLRHPQAAETRARLVLQAMRSQDFLTDAQLIAAIADPAKVNRKSISSASNYVADWIIDLIDDYIGKFTDDIAVQTTISPQVQNMAERALTDELTKQGDKLNVEQGAVVVMDMDGAVRALTGGKDYAASQFNRAVAAKRQPGSAFKPFVYLAAIEQGLKADSVREDSPLPGKWSPENYSRDFKGQMTLAQAMAQSTNTIAVKLGQEVTPRAVIQTAQKMGILSKLEANPALPLGTSEVTLIELTSAYVPFANGGTGVIPHVIRAIRTFDGKTLYSRAPFGPGKIEEPATIAQMNAMMREVVTLGTARRASLPNWVIAGKTGTTSDFIDAWFIGYSGRFVTGVWVGNDDNEPMKRVSGGGLPIDIWNRVMGEAHKGLRPVDLPKGYRDVITQPPPPPPPVYNPLQEDPSRLAPPPQSREGGLGGLIDKLFRP